MAEKSTNENIATETTDNNNTKGWLGYLPYAMAIGVLIAYGFFIHFLLEKVDTGEPDWSRLIYLFSGVEAIVFAAAGFLFGREVNRKRAENAEEGKKLADKQKEKAKEQAVEERKNALILGAMAIQAEKTALDVQEPSAAFEGVASKPKPVVNIANKARKMFPELND